MEKGTYEQYGEEIVTPRARIILEYLSDKMEATARMVGEAIIKAEGAEKPYCESSISPLGATNLSRMRKKGWVLRIPELNAWRISTEGRNALNQ